MIKNLRHFLLGLVAMVFLLIACDDDQGSNGSGLLTLQFNGITQPGDGYVYGVWMKESGTYNLLGDFTINLQGNVTNSLYTIERTRLNAAQGILITLEQSDAIGSAPGLVHVLAGDFVNKGAVLSVEDAAALNVDFSAASGSYILSSPTDAAGLDTSFGVWFYDTVAMTPTLNLPDLGENWLYETWVVLGDTTVLSLGKFSHADVNTASPNLYGSTNSGYPAPGQDFLENNPIVPVDLVGKRLFLSVEPVPDDREDAFGTRPFSNELMQSSDGNPVPLEYIEIGLPRGLATRR